MAGEILPEAFWRGWRAGEDEFRRVRLSGTFLHQNEALVHGLAPGDSRRRPDPGLLRHDAPSPRDGRARHGQPRVHPDRAARSCLPTAEPPAGRGGRHGPRPRPGGAGMVHTRRRAEGQALLCKRSPCDCRRGGTCRRSALLRRCGLDAETRASWPKGGQTRLSVQNNHLQYAITWFALAAALAGMFGAFASHRLKASVRSGEPQPSSPHVIPEQRQKREPGNRVDRASRLSPPRLAGRARVGVPAPSSMRVDAPAAPTLQLLPEGGGEHSAAYHRIRGSGARQSTSLGNQR